MRGLGIELWVFVSRDILMFIVEKTEKYSKWIKVLKEKSAKVRILASIDKLKLGHFSDVKLFGEGVSELR